MAQPTMTPGRSTERRSAPAEHSNHIRTSHTTPSRRRRSGVSAPLIARWRDPQLARAAMLDFAL